MTAKEKAKELVDKYWSLQWQVHKSAKSFKKMSMSFSAAKKCSLIAVDQIIEALGNVLYPNPFNQYWNEVKKEIELL
jgi:hypothetical protein